jgi:hypothetical protein
MAASQTNSIDEAGGTGVQAVNVSFRTYPGRSVGFSVPRYNRSETLVIDPQVVVSMLLGAHGTPGTVFPFSDAGNAIAYNPALNSVYVAGTAVSLNFPTGKSFQLHNLGSDAFIASIPLNPLGSPAGPIGIVTIYFLGGSLNDGATGVALDPSGNVYLSGYTFSTDFPVVNAMRNVPGGGFVAKFKSDFSTLTYSTYVGASLEYGTPNSDPLAIAVDSGGNAYVTGQADPSLFTATPGAFQTTAPSGSYPAFALKLNPVGKLVYATFLGTGINELGYAIAVDASSNAYIAGSAYPASDFPTTAGVVCGGGSCGQAFVAKLNPAGTGLIYSTFVGASTGPAGPGNWTFRSSTQFNRPSAARRYAP